MAITKVSWTDRKNDGWNWEKTNEGGVYSKGGYRIHKINKKWRLLETEGGNVRGMFKTADEAMSVAEDLLKQQRSLALIQGQKMPRYMFELVMMEAHPGVYSMQGNDVDSEGNRIPCTIYYCGDDEWGKKRVGTWNKEEAHQFA